MLFWYREKDLEHNSNEYYWYRQKDSPCAPACATPPSPATADAWIWLHHLELCSWWREIFSLSLGLRCICESTMNTIYTVNPQNCQPGCQDDQPMLQKAVPPPPRPRPPSQHQEAQVQRHPQHRQDDRWCTMRSASNLPNRWDFRRPFPLLELFLFRPHHFLSGTFSGQPNVKYAKSFVKTFKVFIVLSCMVYCFAKR